MRVSNTKKHIFLTKLHPGSISRDEFVAGMSQFHGFIGASVEEPVDYDINKWGRKVFAQFDANKVIILTLTSNR